MQPRTAIIHDAIVNAGGGERVLSYMLETFPQAEIFTSCYLPACSHPEFRAAKIRTLPAASLVRNERQCKALFPVWLRGFRSLDLRGFDVVLTSSTWGAKFIRAPRGTIHACYLYAPFRLLWKPGEYSADSLPLGSGFSWLINAVRPLAKWWDAEATRRIDRLATSCKNTAAEIQNVYGRPPKVIYLPVRLARFRVAVAPGEYYLSVSRLISHKRVALVVEACRRLGRRLVVVGDGPEHAALKAAAGDGAIFTGQVTDQARLSELYAGCRALIFASHEDFGLVPIEAQASGRPVIAYGAGGALETVVENETGVFFTEQTAEAIVDAILRFEQMHFDPYHIRSTVDRFDVPHFQSQLREFVLGA